MILTAQTKCVDPADIEHVPIDRCITIRVSVAADAFFSDLREADSLNDAGRSGKIPLNEIAGKTDGVEDLSSAIGLVGRDAHLGHHLQDALAHRLHIFLCDRVSAFRPVACDTHVFERLERQVRVDRLGAIAGKHAEMVYLARLARFDNKARLHAQTLTDQPVMNGRGSQCCGNRYALRAGGTIRNDQDVHVRQDLIRRFGAQAIQCSFEPRHTIFRRPGRIEGGRSERPVKQFRDRSNFLQVAIGQHRLGNLKAFVRAGLTPKQVGPWPNHGNQAHHQFLADWINRRVGDLGKVLLKIVVEQF